MPSCGAAGNRPLRSLHLAPKMKSTGRECLASGGLCFKSLGTWGLCSWVQFELCTVQVYGLFLWRVLRKKWLTAHTLKWLILCCLPLHHSLCPSFFWGSVFISTTEIKCSLHLTLYFPPGFPSLLVVLVFVFVVSICTPVSVVFVCFHCLHQYGKTGRIKPGRMTGCTVRREMCISWLTVIQLYMVS